VGLQGQTKFVARQLTLRVDRCVWEVSPASPHDFVVYQDLYEGSSETPSPPSTKSSPALSATKGSGLAKSMSNLSLTDTLNSNHKRRISKGTSSSASSIVNGSAASSSGSKPPKEDTCRVAFLNEQVGWISPQYALPSNRILAGVASSSDFCLLVRKHARYRQGKGASVWGRPDRS
jgi:hypothetical protein